MADTTGMETWSAIDSVVHVLEAGERWRADKHAVTLRGVGGSAERHFDAKKAVMGRSLGVSAELNGDDKREKLGEDPRGELVEDLEV
jgi:hypothetical protein